jgi:hypothetical protein
MKNLQEERELYDRIERNWIAWDMDAQFDRQSMYVVHRYRLDLVAAAIWYGQETNDCCVFVGNTRFEMLVVWSEMLGPIIMSCKKVSCSELKKMGIH